MEEIEVTSNRKVFRIFIPKECDLDICNKVEIRGREFVPVVRCRDCKWQRDCEESVGNEYFCADGVRKEQGDE